MNAGDDAQPIRLAMLGGGVGSLMGDIHRLSIEIAGGFELVAGCFSNVAEENAETGALIGIDPSRVYVDEQSLLVGEAGRTDSAQAVVVLTPNFLHASQASACLEAGLHVICEKPLSLSGVEARALVDLSESSDLLLAVTHTYTGYPMVRQARTMVANGDIGEVRVVQVEYPQGWLATALEDSGDRQAGWRTDPNLAGAGAVGDIGTHAANLAEFVTGLTIEGVACDLISVVPGRKVDDNVNAMVRFSNGATGVIWVSQVAIGSRNDLKIRVVGSEGTLIWEFQDANRLRLARIDGADQCFVASPSGFPQHGKEDKLPSGNPRHYFEAFAHLYRDAAKQIDAAQRGRVVDSSAVLLPTAADGARAVAFVDACIASSRKDSSWTPLR